MQSPYSEGFEEMPLVRAESQSTIIAPNMWNNTKSWGSLKEETNRWERGFSTGHEFDFHRGHDEADESVSAQLLALMRQLVKGTLKQKYPRSTIASSATNIIWSGSF